MDLTLCCGLNGLYYVHYNIYYLVLCLKKIDIALMGVSTLDSHEEGNKKI